MRRLANMRKIGHLGTLDPSATGVLPLVLGRATRLAQFFTRDDKLYEGTIHFGYSTDSYDADGEPTSPEVAVVLDHDALDKLLDQFRGEIWQTPPAVSAKKIGGRPAYELARKNLPVELAPVRITIHEITVLSIAGCEARVRIHCASGDFRIEQARTIEQLTTLAAEDRLASALIPAAELLPEFPSEFVDLVTTGQIRNGRDFRVSPFHSAAKDARFVKAISAHGELIAIGEAKLPMVYHPVLVL
jgi:tRNA pseudouridine55 synthase